MQTRQTCGSLYLVNHKNILYVLFTYVLEFETLEKIPLIDTLHRIDEYLLSLFSVNIL
jgi:hypothetical protein